MGKIVRSARGEQVDFDLIKIKKEIAARPAPMEVKARQDFIENRLKRKIKKAQNSIDLAKEQVADKDIVQKKMPAPADSLDESHIESPKQPVSEALEAVKFIDEPETIKEEKAEKELPKPKRRRRTTKQLARPDTTEKKEDDAETAGE
jgi:hypothetical protein